MKKKDKKQSKKIKNMEIVKQNSNSNTTNSSSAKRVAGNIYWKYDKATKTGKLILKKENELYEVQELTIKLTNLYIFIKDGGKLTSLSLYGSEQGSEDYYFVSIPIFYFVDIYNNNPSILNISNANGKLVLECEDCKKRQVMIEGANKFFEIINFLANADNSASNFKIKIFIK